MTFVPFDADLRLQEVILSYKCQTRMADVNTKLADYPFAVPVFRAKPSLSEFRMHISTRAINQPALAHNQKSTRLSSLACERTGGGEINRKIGRRYSACTTPLRGLARWNNITSGRQPKHTSAM